MKDAAMSGCEEGMKENERQFLDHVVMYYFGDHEGIKARNPDPNACALFRYIEALFRPGANPLCLNPTVDPYIGACLMTSLASCAVLGISPGVHPGRDGEIPWYSPDGDYMLYRVNRYVRRIVLDTISANRPMFNKLDDRITIGCLQVTTWLVEQADREFLGHG